MASDEIPEYSTRIVEEIECPFCKAKIKVLYKPSMLQFKVSRIAAGTKRTPYKTEEKYVLLVDRCPNCGKSKREIEKTLRLGKEPNNAEVIKRLRDAGLDPSKLK
jgi:uncharacterized protein (DUF2225 family)